MYKCINVFTYIYTHTIQYTIYIYIYTYIRYIYIRYIYIYMTKVPCVNNAMVFCIYPNIRSRVSFRKNVVIPQTSVALGVQAVLVED